MANYIPPATEERMLYILNQARGTLKEDELGRLMIYWLNSQVIAEKDIKEEMRKSLKNLETTIRRVRQNIT